jgi:hypothetical protein
MCGAEGRAWWCSVTYGLPPSEGGWGVTYDGEKFRSSLLHPRCSLGTVLISREFSPRNSGAEDCKIQLGPDSGSTLDVGLRDGRHSPCVSLPT